MLKNKAFWFSLELFTAYLLVGYLVVPWLVRPRLEAYVTSELGRELRFEKLQVNPLTWSVQLEDAELVANTQGIWPGLTIYSGQVEFRYAFQGLTPVVAAFTLREPTLVLDPATAPTQGDRYPFVGLWRQWQAARELPAQQSLAIGSWHIEDGRLLVGNADSPAPEDVLLDDVSLDAEPRERDGLRKFSLGFLARGNVEIQSSGLFRTANLSATGEYLVEQSRAADGSMTELVATGAFASVFEADAVRVDLSASELRAEHFYGCLLDDLLCATISPLNARFDSRLLASSNGIRLFQNNAVLDGFQLSAYLARGRLAFIEQQDFATAQIAMRLPPGGLPDNTYEPADRNFTIRMSKTDNTEYQVDGGVDLLSYATDASFQVSGRHDINGDVQLRTADGEQAQQTHSRLDMQLYNPGASLAQPFINEHLTTDLAARTLELQISTSLDEAGLRLQESIFLEQPRTDAPPSSAPDSPIVNSAALDTDWLLALLKDPDDRIQLQVPERTVELATNVNLSHIVAQQVLSMLTELSAQPFAVLAQTYNIDNPNLQEIRFEPGSAELDAAVTQTLADLAGILSQRPGLGVAVTGVYDTELDKKALQIEQTRTHVALAMAADLAYRTGAQPPDFSNPIVHSVIDEFAARRLPPDVLREFAAQYGRADADQGIKPEGDVTVYYSALFERLVEYAEIPQGAMNTLARYRGQAVIDGLETSGISRANLGATPQPASGAADDSGIPLLLKLEPWSDQNID